VKKPNTKTLLIIGALAVVAYFVYRWYVGGGGSVSGAIQGNAGTGLGSNLNSIAPELVAGSTGPNSGLNYYGGNTTVYLTMPNGQPSVINQKAAKK
jgi:hypothetical protein